MCPVYMSYICVCNVTLTVHAAVLLCCVPFFGAVGFFNKTTKSKRSKGLWRRENGESESCSWARVTRGHVGVTGTTSGQ